MKIVRSEVSVEWYPNTATAKLRFWTDEPWLWLLTLETHGFSTTRGYLHTQQQKLIIALGRSMTSRFELSDLAHIFQFYKTLKQEQLGVGNLITITNGDQMFINYPILRAPLGLAMDSIFIHSIGPWLQFARKSCMRRLLDLPHIPKRKNYIHALFGCNDVLHLIVHFLYPPTLDIQ